jgi:hypothetical protein
VSGEVLVLVLVVSRYWLLCGSAVVWVLAGSMMGLLVCGCGRVLVTMLWLL